MIWEILAITFFLVISWFLGLTILSPLKRFSFSIYYLGSLLVGNVLLAYLVFGAAYLIGFSFLEIIIVTSLLGCILQILWLIKLLAKPKPPQLIVWWKAFKKGKVVSGIRKKLRQHSAYYRSPEKLFTGAVFLFLAGLFTKLWLKMLRFENGHLYAGWVNIWGDWAAHLSYLSSFAYGDNFPPQMPILAGYPFTYTFIADFVSAIFIRLGTNLIPALIIPSLFLSLTLCWFFYQLSQEILKSSSKALVALLVFLLNGGLGFYHFFLDLKKRGFKTVVHNLPREYTHLDQEANIQIINHITAEFIPQRAFLLGVPLALIVLYLFWRYWTNRQQNLLILAALITGLLPLIHLHSFLVVNLLALVLFLAELTKKEKRSDWFKSWLFYGAIVFILFLPQFKLFFPHVQSLRTITLKPGWLANKTQEFILWFWLKNLGVRLLIIPLGFIMASKKIKVIYLAFLPLFIIPNLVLLQPYEWDNTKLFTYWGLANAWLISLALATLWSKKILGKIIAGSLFFLTIFSGALDVWRLTQSQHRQLRFLSQPDIVASEWVKAYTPPDSVFLTAGNHDHPIPMLSGRKTVLGFEGWLWTYGIDYGERKAAVTHWFRKPSLKGLKALDIDYVYYGPLEKQAPEFKKVAIWLQENLKPVYHSGEITILKTP